MCGIVGYAGKRRAAEIIYDGLIKLEYRGYDSAGIATLSNGKIYCHKRRGRVGELKEGICNLLGEVGIGHTRWATHGEPSDKNAHPHTEGKFSVVHNGIIENYTTLKERFFKGEKFFSDTDSEIIVKLLNYFYDGDLLKTLKKTEAQLEGSYAAAIICADFDGFAVIKKDSPIVLGFGKGENFAASDAPALAGVCEEISILSDGDIALVRYDGVEIFKGGNKKISPKKFKNPATIQGLDLAGCKHYMIKEIFESPETVERTSLSFYSAEEGVKKVFAGADRVIIIGCGTAYNSGLVAKKYFENFAKITVLCETAGEFRYSNPIITKSTAVIAISQSGETADTVEGVKLAKSLGAKVAAVTNAPYSQLTRLADAVIPVSAGPEICVAATKSYIGQIVALYLMARTIAGFGLESSISALSPFSNLLGEVIKNEEICTLADMCARSSGVYFLGRGIDYAVALEGSLKLKEISYIPSEGYPAGELKHGTLALIDIKTVSIVIMTDKKLAKKCENAVEQVLSRKGKAAIISNLEGIEERFGKRASVIKIPKCDEWLSPILTAAAVQLLAYKTALLLDRDPDKPRNLAKSVTVE